MKSRLEAKPLILYKQSYVVIYATSSVMCDIHSYLIISCLFTSLHNVVTTNPYGLKSLVRNDVTGYNMDSKLSCQRVKTYVNDTTGEVVVGVRGISGFQDVLTDAKLFFTPTKKLKQ